jgi:thiol-disulfide isomerase/thioredoxin
MHIKNTLTIIALSALGICIFLSLAKQSKMRSKSKATMDKLGGILLFIAIALLAVSQLLKETKSGFELAGVGKGYKYDPPHNTDHQKGKKGKKGKKEVVILSAISFCGYCKKLHKNLPEIKKELKKIGFDVTYVTDTDNKAKFDKLAKQHGVTGYPSSIVLSDGKVMGKVSGFLPTDKFVEKVKSHVK